MEVEIDVDSGFCYGVVRAIRMAEDELRSGEPLFSLGDIVHNEQEVERLGKQGMYTINHRQLAALERRRVLIRAHGEPPSTYRQAEANEIRLTDATCPVVLGLQRKVHKAFIRAQETGGQVVIYGKPGHAEVNGLVGQTDDTAVVLAAEDEIDRIDVSRPVYLFAQTTMTIAGLERIRQAIEQRRSQMGVQNVPFEVNDTICRQVSGREPKLKAFAAAHDVIVFVCGSKSSNGKALFDVCHAVNPHSYIISRPEDIERQWFQGVQSIGICGATSTPRWLMEAVAECINDLTKN